MEELLRHPDPSVRADACSDLADARGLAAARSLVSVFDDPAREVRSAAAAAVASLGNGAVDVMGAALRDDDWLVRSTAVQAAGALGSPEAVRYVTSALEDPHRLVREEAVEVLGRLEQPGSARAVMLRLRDPEWRVRRRACEALGRIRDPSTIHALVRRVRDPSTHVRAAAASALGQLSVPESFEALLEALRDEEETVREAACAGLASLGDERAVGALLPVLSDDRRSVRRAAARGLTSYKGALEPLLDVLADARWSVRHAAGAAIVVFGERAVPPLIRRLGADEAVVRTAAAGLLQELGEGDIAEAVVNRLEGRPGSTELLARLAAEGDVRAVDPLRNRLIDVSWTVRRNAVEGLDAIADAAEPIAHGLVCGVHLTRFEHRLVGRRDAKAACVVCRTCESALYAEYAPTVVVVVGTSGEVAPGEDGARFFPWRQQHFDFDRVLVQHASDREVEAFCISVRNDPDAARAARLRSIPCLVANDELVAGTWRVLERTFGRVERIT